MSCNAADWDKLLVCPSQLGLAKTAQVMLYLDYSLLQKQHTSAFAVHGRGDCRTDSEVPSVAVQPMVGCSCWSAHFVCERHRLQHLNNELLAKIPEELVLRLVRALSEGNNSLFSAVL